MLESNYFASSRLQNRKLPQNRSNFMKFHFLSIIGVPQGLTKKIRKDELLFYCLSSLLALFQTVSPPEENGFFNIYAAGMFSRIFLWTPGPRACFR